MLQLDLLCVCGVKKLAAWQRHSVTVAIVSQERTNSTFSQTTWAILTYAIHSLIQCTASQTHIISIKFTTSLYSKIQAGIETEKHPIPSCSLETILPIGIRHSSLNPKKKTADVYIYLYMFKRRPLTAYLATLEARQGLTTTKTNIVSLYWIKREQKTDVCQEM